jgi:hypothetical protein
LIPRNVQSLYPSVPHSNPHDVHRRSVRCKIPRPLTPYEHKSEQHPSRHGSHSNHRQIGPQLNVIARAGEGFPPIIPTQPRHYSSPQRSFPYSKVPSPAPGIPLQPTPANPIISKRTLSGDPVELIETQIARLTQSLRRSE